MASAHQRRRIAFAVAALTLLSTACDSGNEPAVPAEPGGNIDPGAKGVIGGSINKAKGVAGDAEQRDGQLEDSITSTVP